MLCTKSPVKPVNLLVSALVRAWYSRREQQGGLLQTYIRCEPLPSSQRILLAITAIRQPHLTISDQAGEKLHVIFSATHHRANCYRSLSDITSVATSAICNIHIQDLHCRTVGHIR